MRRQPRPDGRQWIWHGAWMLASVTIGGFAVTLTLTLTLTRALGW